MTGRLALCGAAAIALTALLFPAHSSAKGFLGAPMHHGGSFHFHVHRHVSGFLTRHAHGFRGHWHNGNRHGYGDGYAYWPLGGTYGSSALEPVVVPLAYPIYAGPRCVHSVETMIVPAELGGERAVRITRC
jgi:hypothetical protein